MFVTETNLNQSFHAEPETKSQPLKKIGAGTARAS